MFACSRKPCFSVLYFSALRRRSIASFSCCVLQCFCMLLICNLFICPRSPETRVNFLVGVSTDRHAQTTPKLCTTGGCLTFCKFHRVIEAILLNCDWSRRKLFGHLETKLCARPGQCLCGGLYSLHPLIPQDVNAIVCPLSLNEFACI